MRRLVAISNNQVISRQAVSTKKSKAILALVAVVLLMAGASSGALKNVGTTVNYIDRLVMGILALRGWRLAAEICILGLFAAWIPLLKLTVFAACGLALLFGAASFSFFKRSRTARAQLCAESTSWMSGPTNFLIASRSSG